MPYQPQTADINGIRNRARQLTNTSAQMYFCRVSHELLTPFVVRDVSLYLILTYDIPICAEFDRKTAYKQCFENMTMSKEDINN